MRKFKVTVEITKEYEFEVDDTVITEELLENWESVYHTLDDEEDKYASLAYDYCRLRAIGFEGSIEGYGFVLENGEIPRGARLMGLKKEDINDSINFKIIDDGESYPHINVREK